MSARTLGEPSTCAHCDGTSRRVHHAEQDLCGPGQVGVSGILDEPARRPFRDERPQAQRALLMDRGRWRSRRAPSPSRPDRETISGLGPQARERIYNVLPGVPRITTSTCLGFRYREDGFNEWFSRRPFPRDAGIGQKVDLSPGHGDLFLGSERGPCGYQLAEQRRLIKTLSPHAPGEVECRSDMDAGPLVSYWAKSARPKQSSRCSNRWRASSWAVRSISPHLLPPCPDASLHLSPALGRSWRSIAIVSGRR